MLTAETLRALFHYDPETGLFARLYVPAHGIKNKPTGSIASNGYMQLKCYGKVYRQHRLAWLYVYGEWPTHGIDHINGIRTDNRITNLRDVPSALNNQNRRNAKRTNSVGVLGVGRGRRGKYVARIRHNGKNISIGEYKTVAEASAAYQEAKTLLHPGAVAADRGVVIEREMVTA